MQVEFHRRKHVRNKKDNAAVALEHQPFVRDIPKFDVTQNAPPGMSTLLCIVVHVGVLLSLATWRTDPSIESFLGARLYSLQEYN